MMRFQACESLVLTGDEWVPLRYRRIRANSEKVWFVGFSELTNPVFAESMFEGMPSREFTAGVDYELDAENGRIRRLPGSAIRDYAESVFYGQEGFNHELYNGHWGNYPFTVHISYLYEEAANRLVEDDARSITLALHTARPEKTLQRLQNGETLTYLVYGDSISTGCEAMHPEETYFARFADRLQRVTGGKIDLCNESIGGETSRQGLARFAEVLAKHHPDLVSIAYGMNDMCARPGRPTDIPVEEYVDNMRQMMQMARDQGAEVIFITHCIPNPHWCYTSASQGVIAEGLRGLAKEEQVPLADVQALWERELSYGKRLSDLLWNDINHPTSYGHYLYAAMLETLI